MNNLVEQIKMLEAEFIELINKRFGIVIHMDQIQQFVKIIFLACQKFNCQPQDYLQQLISSSKNSPYINFLVASITVGESYFFRDSAQMNLLEKNLLPRLIKRKQKEGENNLRIWSAGCSTGEEIYTVAMLLCELIADKDAWSLYLLGTDINVEALEKAVAGVYSQWSMRSTPEYYQQRYFVKKNNHYAISDSIKSMVTFNYLNLIGDIYPSILHGTNDQDLILCRNVLIYFDEEHALQIVNKLSTCLIEGGYLIFGASDPIVNCDTLAFHHEEAIYFVANR